MIPRFCGRTSKKVSPLLILTLAPGRTLGVENTHSARCKKGGRFQQTPAPAPGCSLTKGSFRRRRRSFFLSFSLSFSFFLFLQLAMKAPFPTSARKKRLRAIGASLHLTPPTVVQLVKSSNPARPESCGLVVRPSVPLSLDRDPFFHPTKREKRISPRPSGQAPSWRNCCSPHSSSVRADFRGGGGATDSNYITDLAQRTTRRQARGKGGRRRAQQEAALATCPTEPI